jgi:hypothetical protein
MLDDVHQKIINSLQVRVVLLVAGHPSTGHLSIALTPEATTSKQLTLEYDPLPHLPSQSMKGNAELFKKLGAAASHWHDKLGGMFSSRPFWSRSFDGRVFM